MYKMSEVLTELLKRSIVSKLLPSMALNSVLLFWCTSPRPGSENDPVNVAFNPWQHF